MWCLWALTAWESSNITITATVPQMTDKRAEITNTDEWNVRKYDKWQLFLVCFHVWTLVISSIWLLFHSVACRLEINWKLHIFRLSMFVMTVWVIKGNLLQHVACPVDLMTCWFSVQKPNKKLWVFPALFANS